MIWIDPYYRVRFGKLESVKGIGARYPSDATCPVCAYECASYLDPQR